MWGPSAIPRNRAGSQHYLCDSTHIITGKAIWVVISYYDNFHSSGSHMMESSVALLGAPWLGSMRPDNGSDSVSLLNGFSPILGIACSPKCTSASVLASTSPSIVHPFLPIPCPHAWEEYNSPGRCLSLLWCSPWNGQLAQGNEECQKLLTPVCRCISQDTVWLHVCTAKLNCRQLWGGKVAVR